METLIDTHFDVVIHGVYDLGVKELDAGWGLRHKRYDISLVFVDEDNIDKHMRIPNFKSVGEPTVYDVVMRLIVDSQGIDYNIDFKEWCRDYGLNSDSLRALKMYKSMCKQYKMFLTLVGDDLFDQFMDEVDVI